MGSKVCRRQVCMSPTHREVPKTNGHSVNLPPSIKPELHASPRLGRPLNLRPFGTPRYSLHLQEFPFVMWFTVIPRGLLSVYVWLAYYHFCVCSFSGAASSNCTSMYEKTFPIKVVQSPTHSTSSGRIHRVQPRCTAQEVRHQDNKAPCDSLFRFCISLLTSWFSSVLVQSVCEEEKEVYRQLLTMVSGGQSSFLHNGSSHAIMRSHRDLYVSIQVQ